MLLNSSLTVDFDIATNPDIDQVLTQLRVNQATPQLPSQVNTAGVTSEARRNMASFAAEQIVGILKGGKPPRLINPEAWPAYTKRFEEIMCQNVIHVG